MNMDYWLTGASMIFASAGFWSLIRLIYDKKSNRSKAILGLTYLAVKMSCTKLLERGYATPEEIEDIEKYMFEPYEAMGGNGTAKMLMEKVKQLPLKKESEL